MRYAYLRKMILGMAVVWLILGWVSVALSAEIKLAWDANTEPDLAGYKIYYGTASYSYGTPTNVGNVTSYTLTGLTAGQTYYISVTAYDSSNNESGQSNEVSGVATNPSQTVAVTIAANPTGRQITVDEVTSTAPQTFNWTAGSSHTIGVSSPQNGTSGIRYAFASWSDGGAQTHTITVPSSAATYTAAFTTQYTLTASASTGGTVSPSGTNWYNSGQSVSVTATPNAGYSFSNWSGDLTGSSNPASITMNGPRSITANFSAITETVSAPSTPSGPSSGTTGVSYTYSTSGSTSNLGHSIQYRFDWRDGTYSNWSSTTSASKTWSSAGSYSVQAQARCATHTTVLSSWSSSLTVNMTQAGVSCTVATSPAGLQMTVDETNYNAPQTFTWAPGSSHSLSVNSPQSGSSGTHYIFASWSDGGTRTHTIAVPSSATTYTANFTTQYSLTTSVNPLGTGTVNPSGTNWYNSGHTLSISASAGTGYTFANWSGDLTGSSNPGSLTMNGPRTVTANFNAVPGSLAVTPSGPVNSSGNRGGPFSPSSQVYTLQNTGGAPFNWMASKSQAWTSLSKETGSLSPGASTTVTVSINETANTLATGSYSDTMAFTNTSDHSGDTARSVNLTVNGEASITYKIDSQPSALQVWVDGTSYKAPKNFKWQNGSSHTVSAVDPQDRPNGKRYRFSSWSDGGSATHTLVAPPGATTYTASFFPEFSLKTSVNNVSGGTVNPSGTQWYEKGEAVSITATPGGGYNFENWTGPTGAVVIGKNNPLSVTMNGAKKVRANFTHITYPLVVNTVPFVGGTVLKAPSKTKYFHGEQVTLTAKPKYAYTFSGWGGDATGTERTITITIDGQKTVTASFAEDPDVPRVASPAAKTQGRLPLIGQLESPGDGKNLSGVKAIYGWALDGEAVTKVELFIDGHYVCRIPYGGLREDLRERHPTYPGAEQAGFALVWNYSVLSAGEHTVGIRVHNSRGEALDLSAKVFVVKFHGDLVTDMNPDTPYSCPVTVTADGVTRTYEVNLQWLGEIQDFGIIEIVPKD